jgi:hypothetical protein
MTNRRYRKYSNIPISPWRGQSIQWSSLVPRWCNITLVSQTKHCRVSSMCASVPIASRVATNPYAVVPDLRGHTAHPNAYGTCKAS